MGVHRDIINSELSILVTQPHSLTQPHRMTDKGPFKKTLYIEREGMQSIVGIRIAKTCQSVTYFNNFMVMSHDSLTMKFLELKLVKNRFEATFLPREIFRVRTKPCLCSANFCLTAITK